MSDPASNALRDRIAALLELLRPVTPMEAADAVIAELGLVRASRPNDYGYVQYPAGDRYITKWIDRTDDDE